MTEFLNASVDFEGRLNGMNEADAKGSYIGLSIAPDHTGVPVRIKISLAQAEILGRDLLKNT